MEPVVAEAQIRTPKKDFDFNEAEDTGRRRSIPNIPLATRAQPLATKKIPRAVWIGPSPSV